jgi:asparagine synthase (glutamine-hydrolysing)
MRSIVGVYQPQVYVSEDRRALIRALATALLHDPSMETALYVDDKAALGEVRWSHRGGEQEGQRGIVANREKGLVIVADAEITNSAEIRQFFSRRGRRVENSTQAEMILFLYEELGEECLSHLRGSFAFAVWDSIRQCLFLARDRMGLKPLLYLRRGSTLYFSSHMDAFGKVPGFSPTLSSRGIYRYFQFRYVPDPHTIYEEIRRVPAGHYLEITGERFHLEPYWQLDVSEKIETSWEEASTRYLGILRSTVEEVVVNKRCKAFAVSGGIDSWSVVSQARDFLDAPPMTFTMGFDREADQDLLKADLLSQHFRTHHRQMIMEHRDLLHLPTILRLAGEPLNVFPALLLFCLTEFAASYEDKLAVGEGADEIFAGYGHHLTLRDMASPRRFSGLSRRIAALNPTRFWPQNTQRTSMGQVRSKSIREMGKMVSDLIFSDSLIADRVDLDGSALLEQCFLKSRADNIIDGTLYQDLFLYSYFRFADIGSRAFDVSILCPYLDQKMVEFAFSLPTPYKISPCRGTKENKILLRRALSKQLPPAVTSAEKLGFGQSSGLNNLLGNGMKEFARHVLFQRRLQDLGCFKMAGVEETWQRYRGGEKDLESVLWGLIIFELWSEISLLGRSSAEVEEDLALQMHLEDVGQGRLQRGKLGHRKGGSEALPRGIPRGEGEATMVNRPLSCSVIIPCFNEEDNIRTCIEAVPYMGKWTEIVVVDDGSTDETARRARELAKEYGTLKIISYQENRGKAQAVKEGFDHAAGDVLMILDADMAVPPEELPLFFEALSRRQGIVVNGTRMVYPMEAGAMGRFRFLGNRFFSLVLTWITKQKVTDTLCGTKALLQRDYSKIKIGQSSWGDFDILLGAAAAGLEIVEVPVHYRRRKAGASKMRVLRDGVSLSLFCLRVALNSAPGRIFRRSRGASKDTRKSLLR